MTSPATKRVRTRRRAPSDEPGEIVEVTRLGDDEIMFAPLDVAVQTLADPSGVESHDGAPANAAPPSAER